LEPPHSERCCDEEQIFESKIMQEELQRLEKSNDTEKPSSAAVGVVERYVQTVEESSRKLFQHARKTGIKGYICS
jgi:hypothetical protein